jgi:hypothetical protein
MAVSPAPVLDRQDPSEVGNSLREDPDPSRQTRAAVPTRVLWAVLFTWAAIWALVMNHHGGVSWHYFDQGGLALVDVDDPTGSIHVYATHPDLQFGPLSMVAAAGLSLLGVKAGLVAAQVLGAGAGLVVLYLTGQVARQIRPLGTRRRQSITLLLAGLAFLPVWMNLAVRFVHIDDVLALLLVVSAIWAAVHRYPIPAALLLGLSAAAKPWALPFLALLLVLRPPARGRAALVACGTVVLAWLPFLVAEPRSLLAARFAIPSAAGSSLRTLGVSAAVTPSWDRPLQMALGLAVAAIAIRRGRWPAVVLLVVAVRIVLDPGSYSYYTSGVLVGALLWDVVGSERSFPIWSWTAATTLFAARWLPLGPATLGWVRTVFVVACLVLLVLPRAKVRRPQQRSIIRVTPSRLPVLDG